MDDDDDAQSHACHLIGFDVKVDRANAQGWEYEKNLNNEHLSRVCDHARRGLRGGEILPEFFCILNAISCILHCLWEVFSLGLHWSWKWSWQS